MRMFHGKAWRAGRFGPVKEVLRLADMTWDAPIEGRVLIRVEVCGIGYLDAMMIEGWYPMLTQPPACPGHEVVGEVVAVPPGSRFSVGDRVFGFTAFLEALGGLGEYAYTWEMMTRHVPSTLTDEQAGGFLLSAKTAHNALIDRLTIRSGETLLVLGAAGGSGSAAVVLGKALGVTVIAAASSADKLAFCCSLGADHTVNYRTGELTEEVRELTGGRGADVVFDPVGGEMANRALRAIAREGRFAVVGLASGTFVTADAAAMVIGNYSMVGVLGGAFLDSPHRDSVTVDAVCDLAEQGLISTPLGAVSSFDAAPDAIQAIADGKAVGKSVIRVGKD
jgi:NADPH2:quinone reductase